MTPAGWYSNPDGTPTMRFWDGGAWTENIQAPFQPNPAWPAPPVPAAVPASNNAATSALVLGIVALVLAWLYLAGFVIGILAVICGVLGLRKARLTQRGESQAVAGLILGVIGILASICLIIVFPR